MKIPYLKKKPELKSCHNVTWEDNYSWIHQKNILEVLRDKNKLLPEVKNYLEEENEYTDHHLKDTKNLQKELFDEIKGRIKLDDESLPFKDHTYEYWTKTTKTGNYSIKLRKKINSDEVEEIWNGDKEKENLGVEYFGVGDLEVSNNDKYLGYSLDTKGSEYYTIFIRDIKNNKIITKETKLSNSNTELRLSRKVALTLFRIMRYKDEYEVARLHTSGDFAKQFLSNNKEAKLEYYLAPPLFSKIDKDTGHLQKRRFGSWMFKAFKILSNFKFLRGTKFDFFGYTAERKSERILAQKIMDTIIAFTKNLDQNNHKKILDFLEIPLSIKGYGHVKEKSMDKAELDWEPNFEKIIKNKTLKKVS